jgi:molybdenum cofactor synthesis domain-containing protein
MVNVLIISIGNELLSGLTVNTNAAFLAENLTKSGFSVKKIVTIPDEIESVSTEIRGVLISKEYQLIIVTGGLGPTWDDSTSKFLAKALEVPINLNSEALEIVKNRYLELFREGLVDTSAAPGIYYNDLQSNIRIYCFPGVPKEMIEMYRLIRPELIKLGNREDNHYFEIHYLTPFKDESLLAPYLQEVREKNDVWIKSLPHTYQEEEQIRIIISTNGDSEESVKMAVLGALDLLKESISSSREI